MLEGRDAEELSLYWASRVTCEQARDTITNLFQGMTGQRWVEMLTSSDAESAELLLKEDCRIESRPDRMVLKADAVSALNRMKADREISSQWDLRSRIMAEAEAANARMKGRMEARLLAAQEANKGKLVKLEGMPVMPQTLSGETMLTPVLCNWNGTRWPLRRTLTRMIRLRHNGHHLSLMIIRRILHHI